MSGDYDEDAEVSMAIEEREAELGYYSDAAWRYREQADDDLEEAVERAQCELCGGWLADHGTDCA